MHMVPHERSRVNRLKDQPFALIGVNGDKDPEMLQSTFEEKGITWRSFWNGPEGPSGPISTTWNVRGWPTIYVLDHKGTIRFKSHKLLPNGKRESIDLREEKLDEAVKQLLDELEAEKKK